MVCPHNPALTDVSRRYFPTLCVVRVVLCCGARFSAHAFASPARRATACVKSDADRSAGASHEVALTSLRRSLVAPYRPEQPAPNHPASALFPTSAPTPGGRLARAVFSASRLRCFSIACVGDAAARIIRGRFLSGLRTGPAPAVIATWPGPSKSRRRPWDSLLHPSQFCFRPRVTASFDVSHPHAVSPRAAASFIVAGSTPLVAVRPKACGRGSWGLAPRANRAV